MVNPYCIHCLCSPSLNWRILLCENYRALSQRSILGSVDFENSWGPYMFMVTSGSKLLVLYILVLLYLQSFVCSLCSVYLSPSCETCFLNFCKGKKSYLHKAFTCIVDLTEVRERRAGQGFTS